MPCRFQRLPACVSDRPRGRRPWSGGVYVPCFSGVNAARQRASCSLRASRPRSTSRRNSNSAASCSGVPFGIRAIASSNSLPSSTSSSNDTDDVYSGCQFNSAFRDFFVFFILRNQSALISCANPLSPAITDVAIPCHSPDRTQRQMRIHSLANTQCRLAASLAFISSFHVVAVPAPPR